MGGTISKIVGDKASTTALSSSGYSLFSDNGPNNTPVDPQIISQIKDLLPEGSSLNETTEAFLEGISTPQTLNKFTKYHGHGIYFRPVHIHQVVDIIQQQIALPEGLSTTLEHYFDYPGNLECTLAAIEGITAAHEDELDQQAFAYPLMHHTGSHGRGTSFKTMVLINGLKVFTTSPRFQNFLLALGSMITLFHDYGYKIPHENGTVEEATAGYIKTWLHEGLFPQAEETLTEEEQSLKSFINFTVDTWVILGTTMVYSPTRTCDLIELYTTIDTLAKAAGKEPHRSNQALINTIITAAILTGICDKNPAAVYDITCFQHNTPEHSTYHKLKAQSESGELLLDAFFESVAFKPYYPGRPEQTKEAFCILFAAHLGMSVELAQLDEQTHAHALADFTHQRRLQIRAGDTSPESYQQHFSANGVEAAIRQLLFEHIDREQAFSQSQDGGLTWAATKLIEFAGTHRPLHYKTGEAFLPFVKADVPAIDADNLLALKAYYETLTPENQTQLAKELSMVLVYQSGFLMSIPKQDELRPAEPHQAVRVSNESVFQPEEAAFGAQDAPPAQKAHA